MTRNPLLQASSVIGERFLLLVPQVVTIVLISRYLGTEFFGEYSLVWMWAVLFQIAASFGLTESLAREIGREPERASLYFTHGLLLAFAFSAAAMGLLAAGSWAMQYPRAITRAIWLAGGTLLPAAVIGVCRGVLLAQKRVEYITGVAFLEAAILVPLNAYWIVTRAGLLPIIATFILAKALAACLALGLVHARACPLRPPLQRDVFGHLWRINLPFGLANQAPALRFDILLLSKLTSLGTLGLYSAAAKIGELLLVFPLAFYLTMLPRASGDLSDAARPRTEGLNRAFSLYFALVIPLGIGILGFAEPILRLIYEADFTEAAPLLQVQMIFFLFTTFDVAVMMLCRAAGYQARDLAFVAIGRVANLALNALLIPIMGAMGAAIAAALTVLVLLALRWHLVARGIVRIPWHRFTLAPVVTSACLTALFMPLADRMPVVAVALAYAAVYLAIAFAFFPALGFARRAIAGRAG